MVTPKPTGDVIERLWMTTPKSHGAVIEGVFKWLPRHPPQLLQKGYKWFPKIHRGCYREGYKWPPQHPLMIYVFVLLIYNQLRVMDWSRNSTSGNLYCASSVPSKKNIATNQNVNFHFYTVEFRMRNLTPVRVRNGCKPYLD